MAVLPGSLGPPPGSGGYSNLGGYQPRFGYSMKPRIPGSSGGSPFGTNFLGGASKFGPTSSKQSSEAASEAANEDGDGKRPRKSQMRRTVDYRYSSSLLLTLKKLLKVFKEMLRWQLLTEFLLVVVYMFISDSSDLACVA